MGIIITIIYIIGIFKTDKGLSELQPPTLCNDIDDENSEREKWAKFFYEQTKEDVAKYAPSNITIQKEKSRQKEYRIQFHFIPQHQNNKNVRSYIEYKNGNWHKWQEIRLHYFKKHNYICQSCQSKFDDKSLQLHELWSFNDTDKIQSLISLIPLCAECHSIAHANRHKKDALKVMALVDKYAQYNSIEEDQAYKDLDHAEIERKRRQSMKYSLDMSLLSNFLDIQEPFDCHSDAFEQWLKNNVKDNE